MANTGCEINYYPGNRIQFRVGVANSYFSKTIDESLVEIPDIDGTQIIINIRGIIEDTVELWSDGLIKPQEITVQESYGVEYEGSRVVINFYPAFYAFQLIVVRFQYTSS